MCCAGARQAVALLPRFTTLMGASTFTGEPLDVSGHTALTLQVWRSALQGVTTGFALYLDESLDADDWTPLNGTAIDPGTATTKVLEVCLRLRWLRLRVELTGDTQVTCWAEGTLQ